MKNLSALLLPLLLIAILAFGGILHATLPHSHTGTAMMTDLMHTVTSTASKELFAFVQLAIPFLFILAVSLARLLPASHFSLYAIRASSRDTSIQALRRGIVHYRRFL
ncbi:MAG: hypothetical protein AB199_01785 [Parcubacteria bacterium C7867-004]|nr:MAG: hypothetical protein AB199_01785 [Parcubacteria bacterium C7867-004]